MNAEEARKIQKDATDNKQNVKGWLDAIYSKIEIAASRGEDRIIHPLQGIKMAAPLVVTI